MIRPTKKTIPLFLAFVLIVGGIFFLFGDKNNATENKLVKSANDKALSNSIALIGGEKDDDNDGLKDWEETLWGTDSKKADTDTDGTKDGDEVKAGRNPAVPGPKDSLNDEPITTIKIASSASSTEKLNSTDIASREFFSQYLSLKQSGLPLSAGLQQTLLTNLINNAESAKPRVYTSADIKVSATDSQEIKTAYGLAMRSIMTRNTPSGEAENPVVILERSLTSDDAEEINKLNPIINSYEKMLKETVALSVPPSAVSVHLRLINNYSSVFASLKGIKQIYADPLSASASLKTFIQDSGEFSNAVKSWNAYFEQNNISFN